MIKITDIQETQSSNNPIIREMNEMGHEQVVFCQDQETGLKAIIAIHSTALGPALGGTRMWNYKNEQWLLEYFLKTQKFYQLIHLLTELKLEWLHQPEFYLFR